MKRHSVRKPKPDDPFDDFSDSYWDHASDDDTNDPEDYPYEDDRVPDYYWLVLWDSGNLLDEWKPEYRLIRNWDHDVELYQNELRMCQQRKYNNGEGV
jgi:hypothetical protein